MDEHRSAEERARLLIRRERLAGRISFGAGMAVVLFALAVTLLGPGLGLTSSQISYAIMIAIIPAMLVMALVIYWRHSGEIRLGSPGASEHRREHYDNLFLRMATWSPIPLLAVAAISGWWIWRQAHPAGSYVPEGMLAAGPILQVSVSWVFALYAFLRPMRGAMLDELTRANRAQASETGLLLTGPCGVVLMAVMLAAPEYGAPAAPVLLMLPLLGALVRFAMLERAARRA